MSVCLRLPASLGLFVLLDDGAAATAPVYQAVSAHVPVLKAVLLTNLAALDATEAVKISIDMLSQGTG